jgi:hypothetical protein
MYKTGIKYKLNDRDNIAVGAGLAPAQTYQPQNYAGVVQCRDKACLVSTTTTTAATAVQIPDNRFVGRQKTMCLCASVVKINHETLKYLNQ